MTTSSTIQLELWLQYHGDRAREIQQRMSTPERDALLRADVDRDFDILGLSDAPRPEAVSIVWAGPIYTGSEIWFRELLSLPACRGMLTFMRSLLIPTVLAMLSVL